MSKIEEKIQKEKKEIMEKLGVKNEFALPRFEKVVLNVGLSKNAAIPNLPELAEQTLKIISGQKPIKTLSRKAISGFKIRENEPVGLKVTLRGKKMQQFLDKLISIVLPRIRDFRGLDEKAIDHAGNLNIGIREHLVFPEIKFENVEKTHGLEITICVKAKNREHSLEFLKIIGFPFKKG